MRQRKLPSSVFVSSFYFLLFALPVMIVFLPAIQAWPAMTQVSLHEQGMARLKAAGRLEGTESRLGYVRHLDDFPAVQITNRWDDFGASFMADKVYVVQTSQTEIGRASCREIE